MSAAREVQHNFTPLLEQITNFSLPIPDPVELGPRKALEILRDMYLVQETLTKTNDEDEKIEKMEDLMIRQIFHRSLISLNSPEKSLKGTVDVKIVCLNVCHKITLAIT